MSTHKQKLKALSPEGIPWKNYKLLQLELISPFSVPFGFCLEKVWQKSKHNALAIGLESVPDNAILYGFHVDVLTNFLTVHLVKEIKKKMIYSGYHGFASYFSFGPGCMGAYDVFRFNLKDKLKPLQQIVDFLSHHPHRMFGIFTDAGGPYFRVKESLVVLSIKTGRSLVPYRSFYSPGVTVFNQKYPAISVKGKSVFGPSIDPKVLEKMTVEDARNFLQKEIEKLR